MLDDAQGVVRPNVEESYERTPEIRKEYDHSPEIHDEIDEIMGKNAEEYRERRLSEEDYTIEDEEFLEEDIVDKNQKDEEEEDYNV